MSRKATNDKLKSLVGDLEKVFEKHEIDDLTKTSSEIIANYVVSCLGNFKNALVLREAEKIKNDR